MNPQIVFLLNKTLESLRNLNLDTAELYLKQALKLQSSNPHALRLLGVVYAQRKNYSEALKHLNNSLKVLPKNSATLNNLGNVFLELKDYENALDFYAKSIKIDLNNYEAWSNKGNALFALGRYEEALSDHDQALSLNPEYAKGWSNKGNTLYKLKRYDEAIEHYDKAISLKTDYAEAWSNKGVTLNKLKRYDDAISHHDQALILKPDYAEAWSNKGNTMHELKRYVEAIAHYDRALSLKPDYAEAFSNKGVTLSDLRRYDEAIMDYDKALSLKPNIDWVPGDLVYEKMKICSWCSLIKAFENFSKKVVANQKVIRPFPLLSLSDDAYLHKKCSEIYVSDYSVNSSLGSLPRHTDYSKIRIGYFSADFKNHAVAFLAAQLFESHDKSRFETYAFSLTEANDEMRRRLVKAFDFFINVETQSDIQIAQLARSLKIDIAIDLTGFTKDARTGIFAHRVAPIQVNYLGYPGTMGADYIDYIIADKVLISPELESCYSEKVVYLPHSYQVNDRKRLISDRQFTRQELGLPENGFVFCCFNNNYKILPGTFASWMRILDEVEGSVLWLLQDNFWAVENLKKEAEKHGISAHRLVFAKRLSLPEHLARQRQADLFLDTFPYNAHTTASDALWAGLPVLTLMGRSFASRVAASLLSAIGLPELITNSQEEYESLAIELALIPNKLADIKLKLANNRLTTPLFDTPAFTKNIEEAYTKMYELYQADLKPDRITIV